MSAALIKIIEQKLGKDMLPAERRLIAAWRESLAYIDFLAQSSAWVDGEKVLALKFNALSCYLDYNAQCKRLEEDPNLMIASVQSVLNDRLQQLFMDDALAGLDDEIDQSILAVVEKTYG